MNQMTDMIVLVVVTFLLYTRPMVLVNFSNTGLGKLILLLIVVATALHSTVSGLLVATLLVLFLEYNYEGMEGMENMDKGDAGDASEEDKNKTYSKFDKKKELLEKHCRSREGSDKQEFWGRANPEDSSSRERALTPAEIKANTHLGIVFDQGECNPCDPACSFSLSDGHERIHTEEEMRPKDSTTQEVSRPNSS